MLKLTSTFIIFITILFSAVKFFVRPSEKSKAILKDSSKREALGTAMRAIVVNANEKKLSRNLSSFKTEDELEVSIDKFATKYRINYLDPLFDKKSDIEVLLKRLIIINKWYEYFGEDQEQRLIVRYLPILKSNTNQVHNAIYRGIRFMDLKTKATEIVFLLELSAELNYKSRHLLEAALEQLERNHYNGENNPDFEDDEFLVYPLLVDCYHFQIPDKVKSSPDISVKYIDPMIVTRASQSNLWLKDYIEHSLKKTFITQLNYINEKIKGE